MKKLAFLLILSILVATVPFAAFAENNYMVTTKVEGELTKDDNVYKLHVSLNDIKDETGVALAEYVIKFDPEVIQLTNADVKVPDIWKDHIDSEMAENMSRKLNDGEYSWLWVMALEGYGIKEDGQLALDLDFSVLKETETEISVSVVTVLNDELEEISANSVSVKVNTGSAGSEQIDSEASPVEPDYSTPIVPDDPLPDDSETESRDSISLNPPVASATENNSIDSSASDNSDNSNVTLIVILSIIGVVAAAACAFVLIKRRGSNK